MAHHAPFWWSPSCRQSGISEEGGRSRRSMPAARRKAGGRSSTRGRRERAPNRSLGAARSALLHRRRARAPDAPGHRACSALVHADAATTTRAGHAIASTCPSDAVARRRAPPEPQPMSCSVPTRRAMRLDARMTDRSRARTRRHRCTDVMRVRRIAPVACSLRRICTLCGLRAYRRRSHEGHATLPTRSQNRPLCRAKFSATR